MDKFTEALQRTFLKLVLRELVRARIRYVENDKNDFIGMGIYHDDDVKNYKKFIEMLEKQLGKNLSYSDVMMVMRAYFPEKKYPNFYFLIKVIDEIGEQKDLGNNDNKNKIIHDIIHHSYDSLRKNKPLLKTLISNLKKDLYKRNEEVCAHPEKFEPTTPYKKIPAIREKPDFLSIASMLSPLAASSSSSLSSLSPAASSFSNMSIDFSGTPLASTSADFSSTPPSPSSTSSSKSEKVYESGKSEAQQAYIKAYLESLIRSKMNFLGYLKHFNSLPQSEQDKISDALFNSNLLYDRHFFEENILHMHRQVCALTLLARAQKMSLYHDVDVDVDLFVKRLPVQLAINQKLEFVKEILDMMRELSTDLKKYFLDRRLIHSPMNAQDKDLANTLSKLIGSLQRYKTKFEDDLGTKHRIKDLVLSQKVFLDYLKYFNSLSQLEKGSISELLFNSSLLSTREFFEVSLFHKYMRVCAWTMYWNLLDRAQRNISYQIKVLSQGADDVVGLFMQGLPVQLTVEQKLIFVKEILGVMQRAALDLKRYFLENPLIHSLIGVSDKNLIGILSSLTESFRRYESKLEEDQYKKVSERHN